MALLLSLSGNGDALDQSPNNLIATDACRFRLEGHDESVPQTVECNRLHIVRADVIPPCNPRVRAGAAIEGDRCPRAGSVFQLAGQLTVIVVWLARANNQLDDVFFNRRRHMDVQYRFSR